MRIGQRLKELHREARDARPWERSRDRLQELHRDPRRPLGHQAHRRLRKRLRDEAVIEDPDHGGVGQPRTGTQLAAKEPPKLTVFGDRRVHELQRDGVPCGQMLPAPDHPDCACADRAMKTKGPERESM